jgi:hypothetical protein
MFVSPSRIVGRTDLRNCYFRATPPKVEVRGELIFVVPEGAEHEVALEARTASKLVANLNRALDQVYALRADNVVSLKARG